MLRIFLTILVLSRAFIAHAQSDLYHTYAGQSPIELNKVSGNYCVEYINGLENPEGFPGTQLQGNFYLVKPSNLNLLALHRINCL